MKYLKKFILVSLSFIAASCIAVLAEYAYYKYAPITWFVEYESVSLVGTAKANTPLEFISVTYVAKGVHLYWDDVLQCKSPSKAGFADYSNQPFNKFFPESQNFSDTVKPWMYQSKVPSAGYICILKYGPKVILPFGIVRYYPKKYTAPFITK